MLSPKSTSLCTKIFFRSVSLVNFEANAHAENHVSLLDNTPRAKPLSHTPKPQRVSKMIFELIKRAGI